MAVSHDEVCSAFLSLLQTHRVPPPLPDLVAMSSRNAQTAGDTQTKDVAILASLGYKQELKRDFRILEVFGFAFSLLGMSVHHSVYSNRILIGIT